MVVPLQGHLDVTRLEKVSLTVLIRNIFTLQLQENLNISPPQTVSLYFPSCGKIPPPVIMVQHVSFRYDEDKVSVSVRISITCCLKIKGIILAHIHFFVLIIKIS